MRLFIAIDLPQNIKDILKRLQDDLPDAKMSKTHDFHLTLKFLGSCDERIKEKIEKELEQIKFQQFEAEIGDIGVFGSEHYPRAVWVSLNAPEWLKEIVDDIENKMQRLGFKKEGRFVPHITLCRVKSVNDPKLFNDGLKKIAAPPEKFKVSGFFLFSSELSSKGAIHTKLKFFPAKAPV